MASLSTSENGLRTVQFIGRDRRRRSIRLGRVTQRYAEKFRDNVEALNMAHITGDTWKRELCDWVDELPDDLHQRLAAVGLVKTRGRATLSELLSRYQDMRTDVTASTKIVWKATCANLVEFFRADTDLQDITPGDCDEFRLFLTDKSYSETTIGKRIQFGKQFFRHAVRKRLIRSNPFEDVEGGNKANPANQRFITRETIDKVFAKCPDAEWRLIVALSRYGGLRCPSEHLALKWEHVDWVAGRITVTSVKTKRYEGGAERTIPLFPELVPYLKECWNPEAEFVISRCRDSKVNLRTGLERILKRAQVEQWPRLYHNLRASRQTELEMEFETHVVCAWLGNSPAVARKHYLQVTDDHFQRALHNPVQQSSATPCNAAQPDTQETEKPEKYAVSRAIPSEPMEDRGIEPLTS